MVLLLFLLALASSLSLYPAPHLWIWYLALLATEYGGFGIILILGLMVFFSKEPRLRFLRGALGLAGILGFSLPMIQAYQIGARLPEDLVQAYGPADGQKDAPYSALRSLDALPPSTTPQVWIYDSEIGLSLDYYPADSRFTGPRPWVMVVHGGSWQGGDSRQLRPLNSELNAWGYGVVALNYRLAPENPFPSTREDLKKALRFTKAHASAWGLDSQRFFLLGRSAGAQIALLEAYGGREPGLRGVISYYGPADMIWGYQNPAKVYSSVDVLETYLGGSLEAVPERYRQSSPLVFAGPASPPTLLIHGQQDVLVAWEHSQRLAEVLDKAGVPWYFLFMPWATHGADFAYNGPFYQLSAYALRHFLDRYSQVNR